MLEVSHFLVPEGVELVKLDEMGLLHFQSFRQLLGSQVIPIFLDLLRLDLVDAILGHFGFDVLPVLLALLAMLVEYLNELIYVALRHSICRVHLNGLLLPVHAFYFKLKIYSLNPISFF